MKRIFTLAVILFAAHAFSGGNSLSAQHHQAQTDSIISEFTNEVNVDSVESYIQFMQDMGTRFLIAPNHKEVAEAVRDKFIALGAPEVRIDSFYCTTVINYSNIHFDTVTMQYNVVATFPGVTDFDQFCVMGAHYDCVVAPEGDPMTLAPGADDNASGVAALFEAARIFSMKEYQPFRSIELVAFAAEELMYFGHSGGQAYVDTALAYDKNVEMMINNDMIAYTGTDDWEITISNYRDCEWMTGIAEQITTDYTSIQPVVRKPSNQAGADCKYFYEAGIPCVYFMENDFNPFYHTENDLVSNADMSYCAEAVKISVGLLVQLDDWVVSTAELVEENIFSLYPNPTSGILHIRGNKHSLYGQLQYQIVNSYGQVVKKGTTVNTIDMQYLPRGFYFVIIRTGQKAQTVKVVKMD